MRIQRRWAVLLSVGLAAGYAAACGDTTAYPPFVISGNAHGTSVGGGSSVSEAGTVEASVDAGGDAEDLQSFTCLNTTNNTCTTTTAETDPGCAGGTEGTECSTTGIVACCAVASTSGVGTINTCYYTATGGTTLAQVTSLCSASSGKLGQTP